MRHKNADLIIAKANDMSLVLFANTVYGWRERDRNTMPVGSNQYYLCHKKHKEVCLAWLNWENVQVKSLSGDHFINIPYTGEPIWSLSSVFLDESRDIRIKPKKEKRWIAVDVGNEQALGGRTVTVCSHAFHSLSDARDYLGLGASIIEIEVEV